MSYGLFVSITAGEV